MKRFKDLLTKLLTVVTPYALGLLVVAALGSNIYLIMNPVNSDDHVFDYGHFKVVIDSLSLPYLADATLDYIYEGINEQFKIINPKEVSSCGCGVSVQFNEI